MPNKRKMQFLNANALRLLAMIFMVMDHLWGAVLSGHLWMHCVGRLAFPIFAFQISEGYIHTHDVKGYAKRLLVFALISEVPFDLLLTSTPFFPFQQNVLFTMLLGLWAISVLDRMKRNPTGMNVLLGFFKVLGICLLSLIFFVDYNIWGVMTIMLFYLCRNFRGAKLCQLAGLVLMYIILFEDQTLPLLGMDFPIEGFGVLALIFIWLYNGEKGKSSKPLQYAAYAFYPVHALVIYFINLLRWA